MSAHFSPEFVKRLVDRDPAAWDELCRKHDRLFRAIPRWGSWGFDAREQSEIAQAIRTAAFEALSELRGPDSFEAFVKKIGVRKCFDHIRARVRDRVLFAPPSPSAEEFPPEPEDEERRFDPVQEVEREERKAALHLVLRQLDPSCAKTIRLHYFEGLKYAEISAREGVELSTAGTRKGRCLEKLVLLMKKSSVFREYFPELADKGQSEEDSR